MVECKNVRFEKIAECLSRLTDSFGLWTYKNAIYASFDIKSLLELRELSRRLKRIKNIEFRFIRIRTKVKHEARKSNKHLKGRNRRGNP